MNSRYNIKIIATLGILSGIILMLGLTNWGLIPFPGLPFKITILQIPVIVGACLLGWKSGAVLGGIFGLMSFISASFTNPTITSFVFTPLYSFSPDYKGNLGSLIICFVPRIMIGVFSGLAFKAIYNLSHEKIVAATVSGIIGSLTNTLLVMGGIALFFGQGYSEIREKTMSAIIYTTLTTNGLFEIIASAILVTLIVTPLMKIYKKDEGEIITGNK